MRARKLHCNLLTDMAGKEKLESNIPQATKTHNVCAGIDEAGRGPVLGEKFNAN